MPKAWADDPVRGSRAHAPEAVDFATKPAIARSMIERALSAGIPFSWVVAGSIYGVGDIEMALRRAEKGYVLDVSAKHAFTSWRKAHAIGGTAGGIAEDLPPEAWQRLSTGTGTKGERFRDLAYLDLADLDADEFNADLSGFWTRGLLIRRNIANGDLAFFTTRSSPPRCAIVGKTATSSRGAFKSMRRRARHPLRDGQAVRGTGSRSARSG